MPNKDLNRSNDSGTGAKTLHREDFPPEADVQELSDKAGIAGEPQPDASESGAGEPQPGASKGGAGGSNGGPQG